MPKIKRTGSKKKNIAVPEGDEATQSSNTGLPPGTVQDAGVAYTRQLPAAHAQFFNKSLSHLTSFEKMSIIKTGVSKKELEHIKETAGLDYDQLAGVLSVTRATLINKKGKEKFGTALSERIVSVADIYAYGYEVFEDAGVFNNWVFKPNAALGGRTPYYFLDNQYGREEIRNLLGRIEYGVYS
jgi:putative toxin-antitoxin system antitoxin component (TIGR02293 family)